MEGYKYHFKNQNLVTVWSAPNYCYRCGNVASVLQVNDKFEKNFIIFNDNVVANNNEQNNVVIPYFL